MYNATEITVLILIEHCEANTNTKKWNLTYLHHNIMNAHGLFYCNKSTT